MVMVVNAKVKQSTSEHHNRQLEPRREQLWVCEDPTYVVDDFPVVTIDHQTFINI